MAAVKNAFAANGLSDDGDLLGKDYLDALVYHLDPSQDQEDNVVMVAEDSDSRIHNTTYEKGFDHAVGILIADKGHFVSMTSKDFAVAMGNPPVKQQADFNLLIQPLLNAAGINQVPGVFELGR